jgi:hypothetical protein
MVDRLVKKFRDFLWRWKNEYGARFDVTVAMMKNDSFRDNTRMSCSLLD